MCLYIYTNIYTYIHIYIYIYTYFYTHTHASSTIMINFAFQINRRLKPRHRLSCAFLHNNIVPCKNLFLLLKRSRCIHVHVHLNLANSRLLALQKYSSQSSLLEKRSFIFTRTCMHIHRPGADSDPSSLSCNKTCSSYTCIHIQS